VKKGRKKGKSGLIERWWDRRRKDERKKKENSRLMLK
jgi:hypothetical protein